MPVVLFTMVVMTILAVAAIDGSLDQQRSSAAVRRSGEAFYAAETGLNVVHAEWADTSSNLDSLAGALASGGSLDLGWDTLPSGAVYHAELMRIDDGTQDLFLLTVEASDGSGMAGEREVSLLLTAVAGDGAGYMLGECCDAAAVLKGDHRQSARDGGFIRHSGFDEHPPGWADAGVCSDTMYDKPGMVIADSSGGNLNLDDPGDALLEGDPWLVVDPSITDGTFENFGPYTWGEVRDRATIVLDGTTQCAAMTDGSLTVCGLGSTSIKLEGDELYPRYNGDGTCDTGHPLNWGSDDPADPCFNHFPVILSKGEVELRERDGIRIYGQGVIVMDYDSVAGTGAEFEWETNVFFNGVTLGRGCVEVQKGTLYRGAIFLDAEYDGLTCDKSNNFYVDCKALVGCVETRIQWSQCVVDRALTQSSLFDMVTPTITPVGGVMTRLGTRAFSELLR